MRRGDTVTAVGFTGRRVRLSALSSGCGPSSWFKGGPSAQGGFSLIELVITITVMTILTLAVVPLVKVSVKRQKEQQLRDALREMRIAIDEFHRDTVGMLCVAGGAPPPPPQPGGGQGPNQNIPIDPRSKVVISDCTIFGVDNPDRYPPDLSTLVAGVNVIPRAGGGLGRRGDPNTTALEAAQSEELSTKKKVYLRAIPVDPMTGKAEWDLRSCYDATDADSWGGENIFDVRSKSKGTALNGEKYSDW
jgi:general secretion pathway protein G